LPKLGMRWLGMQRGMRPSWRYRKLFDRTLITLQSWITSEFCLDQ